MSRTIKSPGRYTLLPTSDQADQAEGLVSAPSEEEPPVTSIATSALSLIETIREKVYAFLELNEVQICSACIIMLNALVIGAETDYPHWPGWTFLENSFLVFFTGELCVRLFAITPRKYFAFAHPDFTWNVFDFVIVSLGLLDTLMSVFAPNLCSMKFSSVFRIIRLCRILRILRIIRFLKQLYLLAYGFVEAALAIFWVTILMTFVLYVCGIVLARVYGHVHKEDPDYEFLTSHFGTVPTSMLTLFELMSQPDLVAYQEVLVNRPSMLPFLIIFIIFGSFGMIALLTGVISESMFEKNKAKNDLERTEREQKRARFQENCRQFFTTMGSDENGNVSREEFMAHKDEVVSLLCEIGILGEEMDLDSLFMALDNDASGYIDAIEFESGVLQMCEDIRPVSIMEIHHSVRKCQAIIEEQNVAVTKTFEEMKTMLKMISSSLKLPAAGDTSSPGGASTAVPGDSSPPAADLHASAPSSPLSESVIAIQPPSSESLQPSSARLEPPPSSGGLRKAATGSSLAASSRRGSPRDSRREEALPRDIEVSPRKSTAREDQQSICAGSAQGECTDIEEPAKEEPVETACPVPFASEPETPPEETPPSPSKAESDVQAASAPASAPASEPDDFQQRLEELVLHVRMEVQQFEAASSRMGELLALQAEHAVRLDNYSSALRTAQRNHDQVRRQRLREGNAVEEGAGAPGPHAQAA